MLAEVLAWILTPATLDARRTGHLTAAVSLWSRARRCRDAWAPHEARCHAIVERAMAGLDRRQTCLVLGSGLVRDVPLAALAAAFQRVVLVDVVHLWPARLKARRFANVECLSLDVTGTSELLLGRATGIGRPLARFATDPAIDLVISANCLSQIALLPMEKVATGRSLARIRYPDLGRRIVEGHLDALRHFPGRVCLLSDSVGWDLDRDGHEVDRYDLLEGVELPPADDDWDWLLAPIGEFAGDFELHHLAHGWVDLHAAYARAGRPT